MAQPPRPAALLAMAALLLPACASPPGVVPSPTGGGRGTLLVIGGGLDDDAALVYGRFVELAARAGTPSIAIATAATGPQDQEAIDKTEALRIWAPGVPVAVVRREASTADTVAAFDAATAVFFTGGDQERITARYRPAGAATPEWDALQRLLARGGVIAGASAGDAMMGVHMFTGGSSAAALGAAGALADGTPAGPRLAPGMAFLPWALTDSHFFERDRIGRLVAGLAASGQRLGLGVGEDAAVEIDLASGRATALTPSESLLVDAANLAVEGKAWRGLRARVLHRGDVVDLAARRRAARPAPCAPPARSFALPIAEPGQNRQLASWRAFHAASVAGAPAQHLVLDGFALVAWPADGGEVAFELHVTDER